MGCKQSKEIICVRREIEDELNNTLKYEGSCKAHSPTAPIEEVYAVDNTKDSPPPYSKDIINDEGVNLNDNGKDGTNNQTIINNYNIINIEDSSIDVKDPSKFKYAITIYTLLKKPINVLTNDSDISVGELLTSLLEDYKYQVVGGSAKPQHLFLAGKDDDDAIEYDFDKEITFENNHVEYYMKLDVEYDNYDPELIEKVKKNKKCHRKILEDIKENLNNGKMITVNIKQLTGKITSVQINTHDTVQQLKEIYEMQERTPKEHQRLIFNSEALHDSKFIEEYKIEDNENIHLVLKLGGGMFHESSGRNGNYTSINKSYYKVSKSNRRRPCKPIERVNDEGKKEYVYSRKNDNRERVSHL